MSPAYKTGASIPFGQETKIHVRTRNNALFSGPQAFQRFRPQANHRVSRSWTPNTAAAFVAYETVRTNGAAGTRSLSKKNHRSR